MDVIEKEIFKTFLRFLKENKLMKTYKDNLYDYVKKRNYKAYEAADFNIQEYIFRHNHGLYKNRIYMENFMIKDSMVWEYTIKGYDFWKNVDEKWKLYFLDKKLTQYLLT